jgi:hypothetical protein
MYRVRLARDSGGCAPMVWSANATATRRTSRVKEIPKRETNV